MRIFALILFSAIAFHTRAQEFTYRQFTTADGLPSNVVYGAYQDNNGYIWFCTSAGVSRFNGITFQNFTVEQGLSDNEVFGAFQTPSGKIWFRTFSNKLCYYENGSFHNGRTDPWLDKMYGGMKVAFVDSKGLVWTRSYIDTFVYVMDEKHKAINRMPAFFKDSSIIVTPRGVDTIPRADERLMFQVLLNFEKKSQRLVDAFPDIVSYFKYVRNEVEITCQKYPTIPRHFVYYVLINSASVQRFKLYELIYPSNNPASRAKASDGYWVTTGNKGILNVRKLNDVEEQPDVYLPDRNVNNLLVDKEGNYWFTSPTEGVFLLTAHGVKTYKPGASESEIYSVTGNDKYIICGKNNDVLFINRQTGSNFTWRYDMVRNSSVYNRIKDLLIDRDDHCWVATDIGVVHLQFSNGKAKRLFPPVSFDYDLFTGAMKCLSMASDNTVFLGSHAMLTSIAPSYHTQQLVAKRITALVEDTQARLLVGSTDGLYQYTIKGLDTFRASNGKVTQHITDLEKTKDFVCVATNDGGLILIRNNKMYRITAMDVPENLTSNICRKLFIDERNSIWASTNKGLCKIDVESWEPFRYDVQTFTTDDGLISNDVNDVYVSKDTVWVATSGGLSFFSQAGIKQSGLLPQIYISQADTLDNRSFDYRSKIVIGLEGISYESLGKLRYRYRLKGLYSDWRFTDRNQLLYDVLPPGQYELEVYSINRFGQESEHPARAVFTVVPPWWKTDWAYALYGIGLVSLLLTSFLLVRSISRRKERNRMKHIQQLQQLELKALRSQMNPHFIFNTLNAVQKYILENDKEASYRYLTRFSKLIRGFLENSRQTTVSLQHELDLLRSYMEMETLRFRNKFSYEIEIDPTLDTASVYIPSMLIQPYVENAIWHGIQHKKANGFVKLSVQDLGGNVLKCRILDNGIGRKKAGEIESATGSQHQPVGMTITQQRLELINQRLKQAVSVNYIDIAEESNGAGTGTIVELIVTYLTKKP
jgi:ligand-binding sensor domain-containing protein